MSESVIYLLKSIDIDHHEAKYTSVFIFQVYMIKIITIKQSRQFISADIFILESNAHQ